MADRMLFRSLANVGIAGKRLLEAHDASSERKRRCDYSGVCRNSRAARAGSCTDFSRPHARLRMSAWAGRSPVSCVDPWRPHRGFDGGAGPDAVLAFFISRVANGLGGVLETRAPAGLARSARPDQA